MELPEAKLIRSEVLIRDMQLTDDVKMARKSLVRWLALSLGLITPKESRQSVLQLLEALLFYHLKEKREPNYQDIQDFLKTQNVEMNEKTVRYHLTQLKKAGVIEDARGVYRFTGFNGDNLSSALEQSYKQKADVAFSNIKQAVDLLKRMHEE
jgi:hypothetical protein